MVPGDSSRIVDTDPGELGAYVYIIGVKVKMSLIAKRNILPEALKIPKPISFSVFYIFLPIYFKTNRASLRHYIYPTSFSAVP